MAVKKWVWWVLGIFLILCLTFALGVGACVYFVASHLDTRAVSQDQAEAEFRAVRERFKDQQPLLQIRSDGQVLVERLEQRAGTYKGPAPHALRILAWERGESHRVRLTLPFWLLKMKGNLDLRSEETGLEKLNVRVEDIERAGPALLIDHTDGRSRLLVWTE
jgi:hypothetical protein